MSWNLLKPSNQHISHAPSERTMDAHSPGSQTQRCVLLNDPVNTRALPTETGWLVQHFAQVWDEPRLRYQVTFDHSARMTRALGKSIPQQNLIRISATLLSEGWFNYYVEVVCHELAHQVVFWRYGHAPRPHGKEWQALMHQAGFIPRVKLPIPEHAQMPKAPKRQRRQSPVYLYQCPNGHGQRIARRRMPGWRCKVCLSEGKEGLLLETRLR